MTIKKWLIQSPDEEKVKELEKVLDIPSIAAKILVARGFENPAAAKQFINIDESFVHDPFLLHGMDLAVERIKKAIEANEKILVYGDYDAGATRF